MNKPTNEEILKRAFWLAFQASSPMGYGFMHVDSAARQTEDSLFKTHNRAGTINTDYVNGRMMKTTFEIKDDKVVIHPATPRCDYQSWGVAYATAEDLLNAAIKSLE